MHTLMLLLGSLWLLAFPGHDLIVTAAWRDKGHAKRLTVWRTRWCVLRSAYIALQPLPHPTLVSADPVQGIATQ
jgi:hypothetical protein